MINGYAPQPVRAQNYWNIDLGLTQPVGGSTPTAPVAQPQPQTDPWATWTPKGKVFDHAYDDYQFSRFPLSIGGVGLWAGNGVMRGLASAISKIPQERLQAYAVRQQFMKIDNLPPDHARLLQRSYFSAIENDPNVARQKPLEWLSQFGQSGSLAAWLVRGPQIVVLEALRIEIAMKDGFTPDGIGSTRLRGYGEAAMRLAPPPAPKAPQQP